MRLNRYRDGSWWIRRGRWSLAYHPDGDDGWRPLSERYGTTRTWWLWRLELRRHGRLDGDVFDGLTGLSDAAGLYDTGDNNG